MKFKNKITGCVEIVANEELIAQYEKYTDVYELVKEKKATTNNKPGNKSIFKKDKKTK